jgi:hypothetical protein
MSYVLVSSIGDNSGLLFANVKISLRIWSSTLQCVLITSVKNSSQIALVGN